MYRHWNRIFNFLLMGVLFWGLVQINASSPRIDINAFSEGLIPKDRLVLLEGGEIRKNDYGGESYCFTLYWEGAGCLFVPKAGGNKLLVNGSEWDDLHDGKLRLFQFADAPNQNHSYEVEVRSIGTTLSQYGACVYLGPLAAVSTCISSQIVSRYMVTGICFCILVFSLVLYIWKSSEKYLFWLTVYAFLMLLRTQDALGTGLFFSEDSAIFQALDIFVTSSSVFWIIYQLLAAFLNYQVLKHFLPANIFGRSIMLYITAASLIKAAGDWWLGRNLGLTLVYFGVLYICQIICIQRGSCLSGFERHTLAAAWILTVVFQMFFTLSSYGVIPHGDIGLQFHIPPIVSCIYMIAFFVVACHRFAIKFQEADDLNIHLEATVQEKAKEQSRFIRSMLHNLKTPLFSLVGYADMAAASLDTPVEAKRCLTKVSGKAQYVSSLLDRLFLLTQIDANQMVFQHFPVCLSETLRAVEENARLKGKEKDIRVSLTAAPDAFCMGDSLYLQQAFQNIADNAVEHVERAGRLDISLTAAGSMWHITFADNGCGIPAEELPKVFDRYYSNRHGKRSSSGLGLTIAREIIEHHGGTITAKSDAGQGTVFTLNLPKLIGGFQR